MRAIPERLRDASCGGAIQIENLYLCTVFYKNAMLQQQLLPGVCVEVPEASLTAEVGKLAMCDDADSVCSSAADRMFCVVAVSSTQWRQY